MIMERTLLNFMLIIVLCFVAEGGPSGANKRFDGAFQKVLATYFPEERNVLESPILDYTDWLDRSRKETARREEEYERVVPHATAEKRKEMAAELDRGTETRAYLTAFRIVRREQLARKLGYAKWLPPGTPLLEIFSLSADEIKERGLQTYARETSYPSFAFPTPDPASRVNLDIEIKPTLADTRMALLLTNDWDSDFRICGIPYGEVCVARSAETAGTGQTDIKFARSNVVVKLQGPAEEVGRLAAWVDEADLCRYRHKPVWAITPGSGCIWAAAPPRKWPGWGPPWRTSPLCATPTTKAG
jgi:hypothetical protein